jgi:hypothetical protein
MMDFPNNVYGRYPRLRKTFQRKRRRALSRKRQVHCFLKPDSPNEVEFSMSERILEPPPPLRPALVDDRIQPVADYPVVLPVEDVPTVSVRRGPWQVVRSILSAFGSVWEWLFGAASLIVGLAVLAAIPVVQLLSLGYLLEAGGRIARTGRLRDGFIGVRQAARVGSIVAGISLVLLPLQLVSSMAADAQLIDPNGPIARGWQFWLMVLSVLAAGHILAACSRGGRLRYFLWPFNPFWLLGRLRRGGYYAEARDAVWDFVMSLRLPYYFWLGARGFAGALLWLVLPVSLLALGSRIPNVGFLIGFPAAVLLMIVLLHLPFLQMRFAAENRFAAMFEVRAVRACFRRAPWAFAFSLMVTLLFAVPLYLLKIEVVPREAAWLPSLVFLVFIFPARLLTGWAYALSERRRAPRHWFSRWTGRLAMLPVVAFYVLVVFLAQYTAWEGVWSLYEQHAFLLPVPFLGM